MSSLDSEGGSPPLPPPGEARRHNPPDSEGGSPPLPPPGKARRHNPPSSDHEALAQLARDMVAVAWLEGDFVLSSGRRSSYYFDKFLFETQPGILRRVGRHLSQLVPTATTRLAAPELGAVLLGGAVSMELDLPLVIVRKQAKEYGTARDYEGLLEAGDRVTVIEDVVTTGAASIRSIEKVRAAGAEVIGLVAVLDREEGGAESISRLGVPFTPLFRRSDLPVSAPNSS